MRCRGIAVILAGFIAIAAGAGAAAGPADSDITVNGNRHIGADMVRSYFHPAANGHFDDEAVNAALKRLYATNLFKDVKIARDGDRILVMVVENPTIGVVAFEGNKKVKDEDLKKILQSKDSGPLSRELVQSDVVHMMDLYRQQGYYDVHIAPKMIQLKTGDGSRVNLVFEIKENEKLAVRQIAFAGNTAFSTTKLKAVVQTGVTNLLSFVLNNDIYDADRIENDRDLLRRYYINHGYPDVRVSAAANYDAAQNGVVLTYKIDEGPQYRFGKIDIESSLPAADPAALRGALHTQSGNIFDADAVSKTVEDMTVALAKTGEPFASVSPRVERHPPAGAADVGTNDLV
jgi:outer membrane protein insertion porin family